MLSGIMHIMRLATFFSSWAS